MCAKTLIFIPKTFICTLIFWDSALWVQSETGRSTMHPTKTLFHDVWYALLPIYVFKGNTKCRNNTQKNRKRLLWHSIFNLHFRITHDSFDIISAFWWDSVTSLSCFSNHQVKRDIVILENTVPLPSRQKFIMSGKQCII